MCGSGVRTGLADTTAVRRQIPRGLLLALTVCCAAAVGATLPGTAAWLTASTTAPAAASAMSASASPWFINSESLAQCYEPGTSLDCAVPTAGEGRTRKEAQ